MDEREQQQPEEPTSLAPTSLSGSQVRFLEELSDEAFWKYAKEVAQPVTHAPFAANTSVLCRLQGGSWLLPLDALQEVIPFSQPCTPLPLTPPWLLGLVAWRGEVVAVIDLDAYLCNIQAIAYTPPTYRGGMLLIARYEVNVLAFYVSHLDETMPVDAKQILPLADGIQPIPALQDIVLGHHAGTWILHVSKLVSSVVRRMDELAS